MLREFFSFLLTKITAWVIFFLLLALTAFAWFNANKFVEQRAQTRFNSAVSNARERIKIRMDTYEQILRGGVALYESSERVTREEWRQYVKTLQITTKYPGIQGVGVSRMILPEQKTEFEASVQNEGFPKFKIKPEGDRKLFSSIVFLEPFDFRNRRAFGYDMFSEPVRREAMQYAAETGQPAVSGRVTLVQETDTDIQSGFLMYLPVYRHDMPVDTKENRLRAHWGFVYSPFRMNDLMNGILGAGLPDVDFEIFDADNPVPENLLYRSNEKSPRLSTQARFTTEYKIHIGNRYWRLKLASTPYMESEIDDTLPTLVAVGGGIVDLLIFLILWFMAVSRQRLEIHTQQLQASENQLKKAKKQLEQSVQEISLANEKNKKLYLKTLELDELKTQFFANVSHELRTPLTLIIGPVQKYLSRIDIDDTDRQNFELILRNARFLHRHVSNLLDIGKLDAHRMRPQYSLLDLAHQVRTIASNFDIIAAEQKISYQVLIPESLPAEIDPEKFQRIVLNLLSNAFKFTPEQGEIVIQLKSEHDNAVLDVCDNGPGIPQDQHQAIFDRFRQLDGHSTRLRGGTGLGLSIVKEFTQLMKGDVKVKTSASGGACFEVKIPLKAPEDSQILSIPEEFHRENAEYYFDVESLRVKTQDIASTNIISPTNANKILIVEDNVDMRMYLSSILTSHYQVFTAVNGEDGLKKAKQLKPDLILTDIMMPKMSGDQMISILRQERDFKNLPIVVLSAKADEHLHNRLLENGVQDYISKPFSECELLARLNRILSDYQGFLYDLHVNEERWRLAIEASGDGVWDWNVETGEISYSAHWKAMLGYDDDEIDADFQEWKKRLHPDEKSRILAELDAYLQGNSSDYEQEHRLLSKDGSWKWVLAHGRAVSFDAKGKPLRIVGTMTDIDKRKQTDELIIKAKENAEAAVKAKSDFLANMSHEIRTPMNAILGLTHLIMDTDLTLMQRDYLDKVRNASEDLLGILNDILDISKIDSGQLKLELREFTLESLLHNVIQLFISQIKEKQLELILEVDPDSPTSIFGDELRIRQVLKNLLSNALKFTDQGEIHIRVRIKERLSNDLYMEFSVRDTGIGLSEGQIEHLFQPFTQADSSTTRKYGGTGLGLSISKQLVHLMGGHIDVRSRLSEGSQFTFTVKVQEGQKAQISADIEHLKDCRCLVVDDVEASCHILKQYMSTWLDEVEISLSGEDALRQITQAEQRGKPFNLLLLDWKMQPLDGINVLQKLVDKQHKGQLKSAPIVVMLTAFDTEALKSELSHTKLRPEAIITKPVSPSQLFEALYNVTHQLPQNVEHHKKQRGFSYDIAKPIQNADILLVEDNELNQQVTGELLRNAGLNVKIAHHGAKALEMMQYFHFDAILMDLQMPVMDGFEASRKIRALPDGKEVPIIAMTAAVTQHDRDACLAVGMNDHTPKPVNPKQLLETLVRWIKPNTADSQTINPAFKHSELNSEFNLPGFDFTNILEMLGGDRNYLLKLLQAFYRDHADTPAQITDLVQSGEISTAEKLLHELKGAAGNLGMLELHKISDTLDNELKNSNYNPETLSTWLNVFDKALIELKQLSNSAQHFADSVQNQPILRPQKAEN